MRAKNRQAIQAQLNAAEQACARRGAALTELRRRVLVLILEAEVPSTAYQLLERLQETRKRAAPPTIYRAIHFLIKHGLIHKVECLNAFIPCTEAGHHHSVQFLICRRCGSVAEIDDSAVSTALVRAAERNGFHPGQAIIELDGTCAACARRS